MSTKPWSADRWRREYHAYLERKGSTSMFWAKRLTDIVLAYLACFALLPVLLFIGLIVRATSRGPVLFRQDRLGRFGAAFRIYKFRTMVHDAERIGVGLVTYRGDPRVTTIGRFLREFHLDELPQLFNVLRGEMSLVGPRPVLPSALDTYTDREKRRLLLLPGMTGWQQVQGGALNNVDERIQLDLWYVENWTWWLDIKILLRTVKVVLTREGVYGADGWQRGRYVNK